MENMRNGQIRNANAYKIGAGTEKNTNSTQIQTVQIHGVYSGNCPLPTTVSCIELETLTRPVEREDLC